LRAGECACHPPAAALGSAHRSAGPGVSGSRFAALLAWLIRLIRAACNAEMRLAEAAPGGGESHLASRAARMRGEWEDPHRAEGPTSTHPRQARQVNGSFHRLARRRTLCYLRGAMAKKKVLVVDDEASVLKVLSRRLQANNYDVVTAADGLEGLEATMRERPDLIISDIMMPNMDGYTFIRKVREDPVLARIPIIVLTAKDRMQDLVYFQGIKDCDFIVKPFDSAELLNRIAQLLKRVESYLNPDRPAP
jgi:CheY-like chemotaxis protein